MTLLPGELYEPIQFNKVKTERYADVIRTLKDIGNAQVAHKSVTGVYAPEFKSLIAFVDTAQYVIIQKRDSSFLEYNRTYRIDMLKEVQSLLGIFITLLLLVTGIWPLTHNNYTLKIDGQLQCT